MTKVKVFQFKRHRGQKEKLSKPHLVKSDINEQEEMHTVQGKIPDSKEELYVAQALEKLGYNFDFHYAILGGKTVRGGQVLDFLVHTRPYYTVLEVYGSYWHRREITIQDAFAEGQVKKYFGGHIEYITLWDIELQSKDMALTTVRRELTGLWV